MIEACVQYFKKNKGYERVFILLKRQWQKYGHSAGYIILENSKEEERQALTGLLGVPFTEKRIRFPMKDFEQALEQSKYSSIKLETLLEAYFSEPLITNKASRQIKNEQRQYFFTAICQELENGEETNQRSIRWITQAQREKKYGYHLMKAEYEKSESSAHRILLNTCKALAYLNKKGEQRVRLAVMAADVAMNPHYFDRNTPAGKLLLAALGFINHYETNQCAEGILELYYLSGIQPDDLSSSTVLYGISLYKSDGPHKAYETFISEREPYVVTMANLSKIVRADSPNKKVFVFENQMVFSQMCERLKNYQVSMMCTSGQMKTASLLVIDMLCTSGCILYYSGDIDPEGLGIADRVIRRNNDQIIPWFFTEEAYKYSITDNFIDEKRLKQLDKLKDDRLKNLADQMKEKKCAGYQEILIEEMEREIIRNLKKNPL